MAKREVTVVINGEEYVSKAADEAGKGMDRFAGGVKGWFKSFVDLKAAWDLAVQGARMLVDQVRNSFAAFDGYRSSLQKLEGAAKLTGIPLRTLQDIADNGRTAFKLSAGVANEFAAEVGKLAEKAGDTRKAKDALAAFLEIGAARGMSSAETLQAVQQAILGIDEGTDKLFGKNPSVLYKEYADRIGVSAAKLTDQQKAQALLTATVDGGLKVQGTYAKYLETTAGQQEQMNNGLESARVAFGQALDPLRAFTLQLGAKLMPVLAPIITLIAQGLTLAFTGFGKVLNTVYGTVGLVAEGLGKLTGNDTMRDWGARQVKTATDMGKALNDLSDAALNLGKDVSNTATKQRELDEAFRSNTQTSTQTATAVAGAGRQMRTAMVAELEPLRVAIGLTEGALQSLSESAKTQLDASVAAEFQRNMVLLTAQADEVRKRIEGSGSALKAGTRDAQSMADKVVVIARAGMEAAQAFGIMNDEAAATLNSVINMAEGIGRLVQSGGKDVGAWAQVIASAANIISKMIGGDPERRRLISANTEAMKGLRDRIGDLSLDVTGEDFAKIQTALQSVVGNLRGGRGAQNQADVFNALRRVGLGFGDLKKLADQLGIQITSQSGALSVDGIRQLLEAMGLVELGQFGSDYASQLQATRAGFDINQLDARGQLASLFRLGGNFAFNSLGNSLDMNDLAGTRGRLAGLFERMNAGGLSAAELGGLTGSQFLDLISDLILRIDDLMKDAADAASGDTVDVPGVGAVSTGGAVGTVQEKLTEQTTAVTDVLKAHTALHTRIAEATERTADGVERIEQLLIEASRGGLSDAVDRELESSRRALAAQQGTAAAF
jgi:uncharacterized protein YjbJ (UPF0337 family)